MKKQFFNYIALLLINNYCINEYKYIFILLKYFHSIIQ